MSLRDAWESNAAAWARAVREPGWDHHYERLNAPAFLGIVPPARTRTLDLGCGEGRLGRVLAERGHRVVGVDSSAALVRLAAETIDAVQADATWLPFDDGSFDLVVAFMSLHDMDDMEGAVREVGRVLVRGGRFCVAVEHPFQKAGTWQDAEQIDSPFVIGGSYFAVRRMEWIAERDGQRVRYASIHRPLERYARALEAAGLLIETIREPTPDEAFVAARPRVARWRRMPLFLHLRAVRA
ncbi:MAG: class I SAM-dependent methyltransferase [Candidatus Limnocylindria bacterium]